MIDIRCRNNQKLGEVDPDTLSFVVKCRRCSDVWGKPVLHRVSLGSILKAIGAGQHGGIVYPDGEAPLRGHDQIDGH